MTDTQTAPRGFLRRPEPKAIGHPARGQQIVDGAMHLCGVPLGHDFLGADVAPTVAAQLYGFGWLDDLAALGTPAARDVAQNQVLRWLQTHRVPHADTVQWAPDVAGRRLLRLIFHAGIILPGLDRGGAEPYFRAIDLHLNHLRASWYDAADGLPRIEALAGLAIGAMSVRDRQAIARPALIALAEEADAMGAGTLLEQRSPEMLLEAMALLVWAQEIADDSGFDCPAELRGIIAELAPILRALRHADGGLPCFHGGGVGAAGRLDHCLRAAQGAALPATGLAMGFARMMRGRTTLVLDAASPPGGPAAVSAHASTLAFELTVQRQPLIVNCGPGGAFGPLWAKASRATPCHSALCLAGLSSSRLDANRQNGEPDLLTERPALVWAGDCDALGNLTAPECGPAHSPDPAHLLAGHDGWLESHGLTHLRELWLSPDGGSLQGEDSLAALDASAQATLDAMRPEQGLDFDIRFHLHPDIAAETQKDGIALTLPNGEQWHFTHDGVAEARLEGSCLLDASAAAPRPSLQIVLSGRLVGRAVQIGWTLARHSDR